MRTTQLQASHIIAPILMDYEQLSANQIQVIYGASRSWAEKVIKAVRHEEKKQGLMKHSGTVNANVLCETMGIPKDAIIKAYIRNTKVGLYKEVKE